MKRILVVEDHPDTQEFLRSMLELSSQQFQVIGVPSAEEGLEALQQSTFDLIVTDIRLPGMSGLDFARTLKRHRMPMPIIAISGFPMNEDRAMSTELGIVHYFEKPLDAREFLTAVFSTVARFHGRRARLVLSEDALPEPPPAVPDNTALIQARLETLRTDTGAAQALLLSRKGEVVIDDGKSQGPDAAKLIPSIVKVIDSSFEIAKLLENINSQTIHYLAGRRWDLYTANVANDHILAMIFASDARRGRIGTIWVQAQRTIRDLKGLVSHPQPSAPPESRRIRRVERASQETPTEPVDSPPGAEPVTITTAPTEIVEAEPQITITLPPETPVREVVTIETVVPEPPEPETVQPKPDVTETLTPQTVQPEPVVTETRLPEPIVPEPAALELDVLEASAMQEVTPPETPQSTITVNKAQLEALLDDLLSDTIQEREIDSFWDEALTGKLVDDAGGSGISFEEARRQGIISSDFDLDPSEGTDN